MSYRQYTKCVNVSNFDGPKWYYYTMGGAAAIVLGLIVGLLAGSVIPGILVGVLIAIMAYCDWWLNQRLVCLGGDVCAVGFVLTVETPDEKSGLDRWDTDYSINLVLAPNLVGDTQTQVVSSSPQGNLVKETPDVANATFFGAHLPFQGVLVTALSNGDPYGGQYTTACMHAEFEGGGVYDVMQACKAALPLAIAAAVICSIPVIGWAVCLLFSVPAVIILLAGIINALSDKGNPADVNPNISSFHSAGTPDGNGADVLVVRGTWVYDSAHEGWNEIHPIKQCQRIGTMIDQGWSAIAVGDPDHPVIQDIPDIAECVKNWCEMLATADDPGTIASQQLPQNQWVIHPLVDGCQPADGPPPR